MTIAKHTLPGRGAIPANAHEAPVADSLREEMEREARSSRGGFFTLRIPAIARLDSIEIICFGFVFALGVVAHFWRFIGN